MYRFMFFVLLGMPVCAAAMADRVVAPLDPPAAEEMMNDVPVDEEAASMDDLPDEVPDYRAAQKPKMPTAAHPPAP